MHLHAPLVQIISLSSDLNTKILMITYVLFWPWQNKFLVIQDFSRNASELSKLLRYVPRTQLPSLDLYLKNCCSVSKILILYKFLCVFLFFSITTRNPHWPESLLDGIPTGGNSHWTESLPELHAVVIQFLSARNPQ